MKNTLLLALLAALPLAAAESGPRFAPNDGSGPKADGPRREARQTRQRLRRHEGHGPHNGEGADTQADGKRRVTAEEREAKRAERRARHEERRQRNEERQEPGETPAAPTE